MKTFLSALLIFLVYCSKAQDINGSWGAILNIPGAGELPIILHISTEGDSIVATTDSPRQKSKGTIVDEIKLVARELSFKIKAYHSSFKGLLSNDSIAGTFAQNQMTTPLTFKKIRRPQEPKPKFPYNIKNITIKNTEQGNMLAGTLTTPFDKKNIPVVILITGSGPHNRDEEFLLHKPFLVIADHFTTRGIGVLRMDDRGVDGSEAGKANATSADLATDINAAVNYLTEKGYKNIGLLGHSEGGMIAPMVAVNNKLVKFIVSMAGPGVPIDSLMLGQLEATLRIMKVPQPLANINLMVVRKAYELTKPYNGTNLKQYLVDSLVKTFPLYADMSKAVAGSISDPWFHYFIKFDPQLYIKQLKIPVLAINGEEDTQVLAKENLNGWKVTLQNAGNKNFDTKAFPNLNHFLRTPINGTLFENLMIEETISKEVLEYMAAWILKTAKP